MTEKELLEQWYNTSPITKGGQPFNELTEEQIIGYSNTIGFATYKASMAFKNLGIELRKGMEQLRLNGLRNKGSKYHS